MKYVVYSAHAEEGEFINFTHDPSVDYMFYKDKYNLNGFEVLSPEINISQAEYIIRSISKEQGAGKLHLLRSVQKNSGHKEELVKRAMWDVDIKPLKKSWHVGDGKNADLGDASVLLDILKGRVMDYREIKSIIKSNNVFFEGSIQDTLQVLYLQGKIHIIPAVAINKLSRRYICRFCETEFPHGNIDEEMLCPSCGSRLEFYDVLYACPYDGLINRERIKFKDHRKLTIYQDRASHALVDFLAGDMEECLLWSVPGAEDINILSRAIREALSLGGRVGIVISCSREEENWSKHIKETFPASSSSFKQGSGLMNNADITILTFEDIKKYYKAFDLIILDDKSPCSKVLPGHITGQVKRNLRDRGKIIYSTSTPDYDMYEKAVKGYMNLAAIPLRSHGRPCPEPRIMTYKYLSGDDLFIPDAVIDFILWSMRENTQVHIIVPYTNIIKSIRDELSNLEEINGECLDGENSMINITTFPCQHIYNEEYENIIVFFADDRSFFTERMLIGAAGLSGRLEQKPTGEVLFVGSKESDEMYNAKLMMRHINKCAWEMGYLK